MNKEEEELELIKNTREEADKFCPLIDRKCNTNCVFFRDGYLEKTEHIICNKTAIIFIPIKGRCMVANLFGE